ncbi:MAG: carboxypeptidase regulatory-like domain-containing protein [Acidobacteria bacterium]|nr:carboxypeptidase regulatory-like domain-containing protein [Acidobacteriota bacterium]
MKRRVCILLGLTLIAMIGGSAVWNFSANTAAAQKSDEVVSSGVVGGADNEYNARREFALVQGGASGVWFYGYTANDASNAFVPYSLTDNAIDCGSPADVWRFSTGGDTTPVLVRYQAPCNGTPTDSLHVHPGANGERTVLRWVAPASGTYQLTGAIQRANPIATTDIRILQNETTGLFTGNINSQFQQAFNPTVTVAAGDTIDFSVGFGNGTYNSDGTTLNVAVAQAATACIPAPANLQVNVPAENSPADVQSVNPNASLVGDAAYTNTGRVGRAFELDGSGDYIRIEDNAAQRPANAVTIDGWFKFDSVSGLVSLISKPVRNSPFNSYTIYLEGGQLRGLIGNASQYTRALSNFAPPTGVWTHLAFTYDYTGGVSTLHLYANGVEVTSSVDGTANLPLFYDANPYPLLIGADFESNAPQFFLDGQADEVSVYGRALAQSEIFDIVQQGSYGKCAPTPCAQAPNNLVSWFAGEGNALDSKSNNHGALQNGATYANGKVGQAFSFDGTDDRVLVPNSPSLDITGNQMTIEAWINPTVVTGDRQIVSMATGVAVPGSRKYGLFIQNGRLGAEVRTTDAYYGSAPTDGDIAPNVFTHIALVYNGSQLIRYINGAAVGSPVPLTGNIVASNGVFSIGQFATDGASSFQGVIDEVGVYDRALSASEISSVYNAASSGKCKPVGLNPPANQVAWFSGDGDARDLTGLNANGTLQENTNFRVGKVGQAFGFDGNGDVVTTADSPNWDFGTGDFAVEGWFNTPNPTDVQRIISAGSQADGANNLWAFGYGDIPVWGGGQRLNFAVFNGGGYSDFSSNPVALRPNTWHHVAIVRTSTAFTFYLDGVSAGTAAVGAGFAVNGGSTGAILGARYNNSPSVVFEFANGMLDEVSVYKRAVSGNEINAIYNAGVAGKLKSAATPVNLSRKAKTAAALAPTSVQLSSASVTFAQVTAAGTTSESGVDLALLPKLPANLTFTGLAYDISTTAAFSGGAAVCFNTPALANFTFSTLRVLHLENGVWVNRTAAGNTAPNLCTENLASLSPFAIVQGLAPTAASVSVAGRVADAGGRGIAGVFVTLTDAEGRAVSAKTNSFGRYLFGNVPAGGVYFVGVSSKRYSFAVSAQAVDLEEAVENVDFTAVETASVRD